jgi:hypothetical protein
VFLRNHHDLGIRISHIADRTKGWQVMHAPVKHDQLVSTSYLYCVLTFWSTYLEKQPMLGIQISRISEVKLIKPITSITTVFDPVSSLTTRCILPYLAINPKNASHQGGYHLNWNWSLKFVIHL